MGTCHEHFENVVIMEYTQKLRMHLLNFLTENVAHIFPQGVQVFIWRSCCNDPFYRALFSLSTRVSCTLTESQIFAISPDHAGFSPDCFYTH